MVQITKKLKGLNMWEACKIVKELAKKKKAPNPQTTCVFMMYLSSL